ncbi:hypothetical protein ACEN37_10155 [Marinilactibacillus psychrotolerans]|uniref:Yip1 domain-containing protein n=2 Tax=Marinilactibacillus psychrotolerans TaxID=191770 RepID=A0ABW8ULV1_9LACT|nr:hypothetical protein FM115_01280 [Marinilactibacillus psychrotolerans 42ea]
MVYNEGYILLKEFLWTKLIKFQVLYSSFLLELRLGILKEKLLDKLPKGKRDKVLSITSIGSYIAALCWLGYQVSENPIIKTIVWLYISIIGSVTFIMITSSNVNVDSKRFTPYFIFAYTIFIFSLVIFFLFAALLLLQVSASDNEGINIFIANTTAIVAVLTSVIFSLFLVLILLIMLL